MAGRHCCVSSRLQRTERAGGIGTLTIREGGHVWIFYERAIPASTARKLGCAILTRTTENRHELGLDSYDRLFPNQDTMPKGGFGNLIALPLQKRPREQGNSVFLDELFQPYSDQWGFLESIQRLPID